MKSRKWQKRALVLSLLLLGAAVWQISAQAPSLQEQRVRLKQAFAAGNFKDAYEGLRKLALDPKDDPLQVGQDLELALTALQRLGRMDEADDFREAVIAAHKDNWRLLDAAAQSFSHFDQHGFVVAGKFYRGDRHGGGRWVSCAPRDRVRALQLLEQALPLVQKEKDRPAAAQFYLDFANVVNNAAFNLHPWRTDYQPWRLQYLTDLSQLPDFDNAYYGGSDHGAPVDAQGSPIFYAIPKSYQTARSDGERWRWLLTQAAELDSGRTNDADIALADFLYGQFDVQTMASSLRGSSGSDDDKSGPYAVHTLKEDETIAWLANGIKRFKLPDEFNWIKIYERVAGRGRSKLGEHARDTLAGLFENRRQYVKAAAAWKQAIGEYGPGPNDSRQHRLDQIVSSWGRFDPGQVQPAGKGASVDFRYRNGKKVSFEAFTIRVPQLLDDVKAYIKSSPNQLNWNQIQISNLGYRLVQEQEQKYVGGSVATWDLDLKPRPGHVDDRVTVTTPLQKPGAYLLVARMADGNVSRIIVWVSDTVLMRKQLEGRSYYFVADAVTGQPVPNANVEFFGWKQVQIQPNQPRYHIESTQFALRTDADGQILVGPELMLKDHQWLTIARQGQRLAYLGFNYVWYGQQHDAAYNQTRVFVMTDRPVYRPEQTVQFKAWVRHAKYDQPDTNDFANRRFTVRIYNPRREKVLEKVFTTDAYGGLAGEFPLAREATLGAYHLALVEQPNGGGMFRVEEYKKPEFEVKVEAPTRPVALGEQVTAKVEARYYFGAPVTQAKVKIKVQRSSYSGTWYPMGLWDWLYGRGYWWFAADTPWYPGWRDWGCLRPIPIWWGARAQEPPEVVLDLEAALDADGKVEIPIDTRPALELHGNQDHEYSITAEVVDPSRRTIVGTGNVLVARKPFKVFTWVDRGFYRSGDTIKASFQAQTLDQKPVQGKGELTLFQITYNAKAEPVEKAVQTWKLDTDVQGHAQEQIKAAEPGQYRLSYRVTDTEKHTIEGGYLFVIRGEGFTGQDFRFNDIELTTDRREYAPGDKVRLQINANRKNSTVLLFVRPANGVYLPPRVLHLDGKSTVQEVAVVQKDMPNFFIEAVTVSDARVHSEVREVVVPPQKRVLNVAIEPSFKEYKPGQKATLRLRLTDLFGKPFVGSTVLTVYDKSVEYISGGSNVQDIKAFFWKWRRTHYPSMETSVSQWLHNLLRPGETGMSDLGVFGGMVVEQLAKEARDGQPLFRAGRGGFGGGGPPGMASLAATPLSAPAQPASPAPSDQAAANNYFNLVQPEQLDGGKSGGPGANPMQPTIRKNFADTAYWSPALTTNADGIAEVTLTMPESLTAWKVRVWAMGPGTKVGEGDTEVVTKKDLIVRLQAPRFFVEKDEVVLSANVHNYLKSEKQVAVSLELDGGTLAAQGNLGQQVRIAAGGQQRVDWRVKVLREGEAIVRMKAITDVDADAMEMRFPCFVHGMLKTESFTGVIRPDKNMGQLTLNVPGERRINETRLEVRYSPTLAGALVDALPYLVEYPYGCTEQTLNRFVPTVITQKILLDMKLDLKDIEKKRTNLNSQEIGNAQERAKQWQRYKRNPVFDAGEVQAMVRGGMTALAGMQLSDGGWGWFSGYGEHSYPHTTAVVVHGLELARDNGAMLPPGMLERGIAWLKAYQAEQVHLLHNAPAKVTPWKEHADNLDALVYMVLVEGGSPPDADMRQFLYRDRTQLAVYGKALFGLALHKEQRGEELAMILKNIEQYLVQDDENQTAYLRLPGDNDWWYWYGSDIEANAYYLKLLARTSPKDEKAARLVKYLLNNRRHATYWNSTRDTALCIEAMAEYLRHSGEDRPDMTVEVWLDGKKHKEVKIDPSNLFSFDNQFVLIGDAVDTGKHVVEIRRQGTGPVYWNAYLTNFTLEDFITRAGLEVRVNRKVYKLTRDDRKIKVEGAHGQAADQRVERYQRTELPNLATLKSGDLVEVELEIDSKNDYEYLVFEDMKAAGFEPLLVQSGYTGDGLGAYMELRDEKVCFFVRRLPRGKHSVSYRLRAEIPGQFSALPTRAYAMYAPELRGNSDEIKLRIVD
jgi:uncharacterized protein YfaS (alpha-2-macroglobulin family)